ncbi:MAG TPA: FlgD immunoglobulin-like domain containing protein, partial [Candidatus Kapabacteria bacterium]|nr:FlgD immunoglobulin-like domain containing protein [Candidatus Kapabacteria bacterium]
PEFAVYANEVHASAGSDTAARESLSVSDSSMIIRALIHNYGYSADRPVIVRITDNGPTGLPFAEDDTLLRLDTSAIVSAKFALTAQSIGAHRISVVIDPDRSFPESYRPDDSANIQVQVNGLSTTPFYPYEGSRAFCDISTSTVHFIVLTPSGTVPGDQVELELDTTDQFSNILADRKTNIGASYYVTFDVSIPAVPKPWSSVYWWRSRVVRANGNITDWQYASFSTASAARSEFSYTSPEQDSSMIVSGLSLDQRGFLYLPKQDTLRLEAISHGLNDLSLGNSFTPFAQVNINGKDSQEYGGGNSFNGFVLVEWAPDGSQVDTAYEFYMPWQNIGNQSFEDSAATVFNSVLTSIPQSRRVMVLTVGSVQFPSFIDSTKRALQSLGSANGLIPMVHDGSYALIGTKGGAPGTAKEAFAPDQSKDGAHAFDTVVTFGTSGLAETPFTAVAKDYDLLSWTGDPLPSGSDITFTVLGARRDGSGIDVVDTFNASKGSSFPLSNIDPRIYDQLGVKLNFTRSSNATQSPALSGIELQYDAAPELIFTADSIQTVPNLTNSGGVVISNYGISTLTCAPADSFPVMLLRQYQGKTDTIANHFNIQLAGHTTQTFSDSVQTTNELGTGDLTVTVNSNEVQNEQLLYNNSIAGSYTVARDTTKPTIQILFDDRNIPDGGYVSSNTTIQINMLSSNLLRDTSKSSIVAVTIVNLNTNVVIGPTSYYTYPNAEFNQPEFSTPPSGAVQAFLRFKPIVSYPAGVWVITAAVTDASGNTDTLQQRFIVSNVNGIEHVMNYPNPFKEKTDFTFVLKSDAAADMKIVVYTIAGRKIRTLIPTDLHAGLNMIEWDGRDERGNDVADGTYLYRVIINGKDGDQTSDAVTERAVRDR